MVDDLVLCPGPAIELGNPLAATQSTMRRSLFPSLLTAVRDNLNQGERSIAIYEQGRVFFLADGAPAEGERLSVALVGARVGSEQAVDFIDLKGVVDDVADRLGFDRTTWQRGGAPWLDEAQGAVLTVADGRVIGCAGLVSDAVAKKWEIKVPVYLAELDLAAAAAEIELQEFVELPRFPAVSADMTIEHPETLSYLELTEAVSELVGELVEKTELQARFAGKSLRPGVVRTTLRLTYRASDRSLTQDEVNELQEALRDGLTGRLGVNFA
jgi:phenylalanyl-tRNA synthetase beta chain